MLLKSPNPNVRDMKKCLLVFTTFASVVTIEPFIKSRIPLYAGFRLAFLISVSFKQSMQELLQKHLVENFPSSEKSNVKSATVKASEKMEEKAEEVKNK